MSEKKVKLNSGNSLAAFLNQVISEGVKSALAQKALTEKDKQDALSKSNDSPDDSGDDDLFGAGSSSEDNDEEDNQSSKTMDDETEKLSKGDVKPKDVIDKLNAIRAGKSFKDSVVSKAMDEYINSLSRAERVALLAFMKGISQIVTGEISGEQAEDPSDNPSDVKMQKGEKNVVRHVKPNVIKTATGTKKSSHVEDTTAPSAPITPRRR